MRIKAIGLFSGGLDSVIAVKILQDQNIEVAGVSFETPFFSAEKARTAASDIGVPLRVINFTEEHLDMLKAPRHGYGRNMNPCIDCHALMLEQAGQLMVEEGADFLFTGEVLGQRPLSQTRQSLHIVAKQSGFEGYVLRPLSALLLPETVPEGDGRIDRKRLLDIQGRSRKRQIALAERYGIASHSSPAGGCLLTDPVFSCRLRDLLQAEKNPSVRDLELLKVGRHLRISADVKIVVGRNKSENETIERLAGQEDSLVDISRVPGPVVIIPGGAHGQVLRAAAAVCAFYSDAPENAPVEAVIRYKGETSSITTRAAEREAVQSIMIAMNPRKARRHREK